jgi:predicted MPP superfamily phosphohydrolase
MWDLLSRRIFLKGFLGSVSAVAAGGVYALVVEPAYLLRVQTYAPALPRWPRDLPLSIAAIADLHVGEPYMPLRRVEEIVATTNALRPDLILLLGDYSPGQFVTRRVTMRELASVLRGLQAPLGVHAILGNHDWWDDHAAQRLRRGPVAARRALEEVGIAVLENDAVRLAKDGRSFWLLGLGDQLAFLRNPAGGVDDLPGTLAGINDDAPAILLAHEPDIFPSVPDRVALTLSGHTHGGQVRIMGYSPVVPSRYGNRFAYGHVIEGGRHLIVSGGLGTSIAPVRLGVPPEIVLVELGATVPTT